MSIKEQLADDMKSAMRARDKQRLSVIRMMQADIKQREIDTGQELGDPEVLAAVEKNVKKRQDAETQYRDAGRPDLADVEAAEAAILAHYLPTRLSDAEVDAAVDTAIAEQGATSMRDMGAVMGVLKDRLQGQADMGDVSKRLKARLAG